MKKNYVPTITLYYFDSAGNLTGNIITVIKTDYKFD